MPDISTIPQASAVTDAGAAAVGQVTAAPAVKTVTEQATATVSQATSPDVVSTVTPSGGGASAETVVKGTVDTVTQTTDPVVKGTASTATQAAESVTSSTTSAASQATDPVVSNVGTAGGGAGAAVRQTTETVASGVGAATGGAGSAVQQTADTVGSTAGQAVAPVAAGQTGAGVTRAADAVSTAASQATDQAVASATGGGSSVADHVPQGAHGGVADHAAQVAHGVGGGVADPLAAASGVAAPAAGGSGALSGPLAPDPTTSLLAHTAPASAATPNGAAHGTTADALAQVATDPRLLAVTGITALAGTAYVAARAAGCVAGGEPSVILNNVRLIPCLARSSMAAGTTALVSAGSGVRDAAGSAARATRAELHVMGNHVSGVAGKVRDGVDDHIVEPFQDGVARATGEGRREGDARGSDLFFVGIGMIVGLLYATILSLWLLLIRPRWSTRA